MRLNPDFQSSGSIAISWVDKVTTRTWSFVSVIGKASFIFILQIAQITSYIKIKLISLLNNSSWSVWENLLYYLNRTTIFTFTVPILSVLSMNRVLNLKVLKSVVIPDSPSL